MFEVLILALYLILVAVMALIDRRMEEEFADLRSEIKNSKSRLEEQISLATNPLFICTQQEIALLYNRVKQLENKKKKTKRKKKK